ncbi:MAG: hypothetical protein HPZ91_09865 [Lentisphaeria bacterium]|nr:hypothetical protein [Lentisphaeria bacterium]
MSIRLAVATDIHYSGRPNLQHPGRKGAYGALLLKRFLKLLEMEGWPDAVIIAGDLIDPAAAADHAAIARLTELGDMLRAVPVPVIVIPGNHDLPPEIFYQSVPAPAEYVETGGCRIIPFFDPERPGWNAERLPDEMAKFDRARAGFRGHLVALQHVTLFPPGTGSSPYGYVNRDEIIAKMHETGCVLSIGGHHHSGSEMVFDGKTSYLGVPALCEAPYSFARIEVDDRGVTKYEADSFRLPEGYAWRDGHTHTLYAYCSEDMDLIAEKELMEMFNLSGCDVTEHSAHMSFTYPEFRQRRKWYFEGMREPCSINRAPDFFNYCRSFGDERFRIGFEVDISKECELAAAPGLLEKAQVLIGGIHHLDPSRPAAELGELHLRMIEAYGKAGIPVLAHPLRILRRHKIDPEPYFDRIIVLLKQYGMAAEVNFHHNSADPEFTRRALEAGLKLSFGSDSHSLANFGFLQPHIRLLRKLGFNGTWSDILV